MLSHRIDRLGDSILKHMRPFPDSWAAPRDQNFFSPAFSFFDARIPVGEQFTSSLSSASFFPCSGKIFLIPVPESATPIVMGLSRFFFLSLFCQTLVDIVFDLFYDIARILAAVCFCGATPTSLLHGSS